MQLRHVRSVLLAACSLLAAPAWAAPAVPAKIVFAGPAPNSVGYVTSSGDTQVNAQVGRWDTAYPNPSTGEYAPGLEPSGTSSFVIDVDVNDGGLATFRYVLQTYDAGIWDWFDIYMETPDGRISIASRLGKPGNAYGDYWESPTIPISQSLNKWRNQRVRFVFSVMQDGWGDQTVGKVINFALNTCATPPLTAITDPVAQNFENGNNVDTAHLNAATSAGLGCMQGAVGQLGGSMTVSSAFRPVSYQGHLREVWDTWDALRNNTDPECQELKTQVRNEFTRHGLLLSQRPAAPNPNAPHSLGNAFDATITRLPANNTVDTVAASCTMRRPWPVNDPVHYQPQ
jgi:hypothetical protein